jgi:hypothetical protein
LYNKSIIDTTHCRLSTLQAENNKFDALEVSNFRLADLETNMAIKKAVETNMAIKKVVALQAANLQITEFQAKTNQNFENLMTAKAKVHAAEIKETERLKNEWSNLQKL